MPRLALRSLIVALALVLSAGSVRADAAGEEFFEKEVRPLLVEHCLKCHGDSKPKGGLRMTSRAAVLKGGDTGPAAVAGKPDDSLLVQAVRYNDTPQMPPKKKLTDRQIAALSRWVQLGLPWPKATGGTTTAAATAEFHISDEQRRFWSFQPVKVVAPPVVRDGSWPKSDLDRFILAALEAKGLRPAKPADRRTLLRRATFDLTGLPPTPAEIEAFLRDDRPDAFARAIDRLLASPAYGERWGRHWLDLVRYTDSFDARGVGGEMDCAHAWRYRDWVVRAFNDDMPYDRFLTAQIAGDLMPAPGGFNADGIVATGFLALGNWGGGDADKEKLLTDIADDQVDVVSRTFMGLTMACARCHDHKFDPISTADYYGLAGMFFSTHILPNVGPKTNGPPMLQIPLLPPAELARRDQAKKRIAEVEKTIKDSRERYYRYFARSELVRTAQYVVAAWEKEQTPSTDLAAFAREKGLRSSALRRWIDYLGLGEYPLMSKPVRDVLGRPGVHGWRGEPDCPSMLVNTTDREVSILTFKLPPKAVSVHPGPTSGVAVSWRSPIAGTVRIKGRLLDADPVGGDGVAWAIDQRTGGTRRELTSGDLPNGGSQRLDQGKGADRLLNVTVGAGDGIELLVLPKANHGFDTTVVELEIATTDGAAVWDLARDVMPDPHQGNPHRDRAGRSGVWSFRDMAGRGRTGRPGSTPALRALDQAIAARDGKRDRRTVEEAASEFARTFTLTDARSPFWITDPADEQHLPAEARRDLAKQAAELDALKKAPMPPTAFANGAQEGGVPGSPHAGTHDVRIHVRGRYDRLGPLVPRRFPEILAGREQKPIAGGSGRQELARWLTRPDHPLTARVMVNRLWQHHFGEGIVRTPSNFGKLGRPPTHPELLDWLAADFVRSGWSIKRMHRLLMLSAAYQQSSDADSLTAKSDPDNLLFGRVNRRRLEAEALRDAVLSVSGRLDRTAGGPAARDFAIPRRTLYLMTIRSDRSGFGPLFDVADPTAPVDKRTISTVAPQALFLLNNPFMLEQTKALAKRIVAAAGDDPARIDRVYTLLYGRPPSPEEVTVGTDFLKRNGGDESAWQEYAEILLCANEFVYVD